jgi:hypothetical protein
MVVDIMNYLDGRLALLDAVVSSRVVSVQRLRYVHRQTVLSDNGAVQFCFDPAEVRRFDAGADGQRLAVATTRWSDPFSEPLSEENREFVDTSGKCCEFDVTHEDPYEALVGKQLTAYEPIREFQDALSGLILVFEDVSMTLETHGGDELYVTTSA